MSILGKAVPTTEPIRDGAHVCTLSQPSHCFVSSQAPLFTRLFHLVHPIMDQNFSMWRVVSGEAPDKRYMHTA